MLPHLPKYIQRTSYYENLLSIRKDSRDTPFDVFRVDELEIISGSMEFVFYFSYESGNYRDGGYSIIKFYLFEMGMQSLLPNKNWKKQPISFTFIISNIDFSPNQVMITCCMHFSFQLRINCPLGWVTRRKCSFPEQSCPNHFGKQIW